MDIITLKADVAGLKTDVAILKADVVELKKDVSQLKKDVIDLKIEIKETKSGLMVKIEQTKNSTIIWAVSLIMAQTALIFGFFGKALDMF